MPQTTRGVGELSNRDSFQRQTGLLHQAGGTKPLRATTKQLVDPLALRQQTEEILEKSRASLETLQPRIELLMRACQNARLPVPGVGAIEFQHPLSPKGEQIVAYLMGTFAAKPEVAKEVQVAAYRYYEAGRMVASVQAALDSSALQQPMLEELRLKLFYLSRFHEVFKSDRVLTQLFPPPQTVTPGEAAAKSAQALSTVERLKQKKLREDILRKAEILQASLAPKMETLAATLDLVEKGGALDIKALITGSSRTARLLALGIGTSPQLVGQLKEAKTLFEQLGKQLEEAKKEGGDYNPLKETIYPLSKLAITCRAHPMMRDLFPATDEGLFPDESTPIRGTAALGESVAAPAAPAAPTPAATPTGGTGPLPQA